MTSGQVIEFGHIRTALSARTKRIGKIILSKGKQITCVHLSFQRGAGKKDNRSGCDGLPVFYFFRHHLQQR